MTLLKNWWERAKILWRAYVDLTEDSRRWWLGLRTQDVYISVRAIRNALVRNEKEQLVLESWDGHKAHSSRRRKLKPKLGKDYSGLQKAEVA